MASPSAVARLGELPTRALSAAVLAGFALGATYLGGPVFHLAVLVTAWLSVREWVRLAGAPTDGPALELSYGVMTALLVINLVAGPLPALALLVGLGFALHLALKAVNTAGRRLVALGVPYIGLAMAALLWLRDQPGVGMILLFWLFAVVWATDIGGFAAGRTLGGPKLAPRISPNKTWSGLAGAVVAASLLGGTMALVLDAERPLLAAAAAALLSVTAQLGDLFESGMKRRSGVKDSGRLIPGHGGLLDRIDGMIFAAPVLALLHGSVGRAVAWW